MATKIGNLYAFCAFFKTADKLLKKFIGYTYLTQYTFGGAPSEHNFKVIQLYDNSLKMIFQRTIGMCRENTFSV